MGKKIPLTISTLIIGMASIAGTLASTLPTHAIDIRETMVDPSLLPLGIEVDGQRYWSVSEMQEASMLIDAKRSEVCGGDLMCIEDLSWQQMDEFGGIYRALEPFDHIHFMLTYINPAQNRVKFLYHDEDKMNSRMIGEILRYDIASVYAVWVDESLGNVSGTSSNWLANGERAPYHLGSVEEVEAATHLIFDESETELGRGWFTPNIEREYYVEGNNLADNTSGQLFYSLNMAGGGGHTHGVLDYSDCLKSPNYAEGMECSMMYREDGWYTYLPSASALAITASLGEEDILPTSDTDQTIEQERGMVSELAAEPTEVNSTPASATFTSSVDSNTPATTPNTGYNTNQDQGATELPWWCLGIFGIGLATLIWLFWPKNFKKAKKVQKNTKNMLTKKSKCDKMVSV